MARTPRGPSVAIGCIVVVLSLAPSAAASQEAGAGGIETGAARLAALAGLGFDWETAESSPTRCLLGLVRSQQAAEIALIADCGIPWEPSVGLEASFTFLELRLLRLSIRGQAWLRTYGGTATEIGAAPGAGLEIGPRRLAFAAAGGVSLRSTRYQAISASLGDLFPWARVGVTWRPIEPARFGLAIASDSPLALWLRTSFELSGFWRFASGIAIEGLLAARYSDFFTLTSYLDGFDLRAAVTVPIAGGDR